MFSVVVVCAGSSRRYRLSQDSGKTTTPRSNKTLELIGGIPVFIHSLLAFKGPGYHEIILTVSPEDHNQGTYSQVLDEYSSLANHRDLVSKLHIVAGGSERYHSVERGLEHCSPNSKWVMIHDAARPLIHPEDLSQIRNTVEAHIDDDIGILPVIPTTDTIKKVDEDGWVCGNLPRPMLRGASTPQCFPIALLRQAYQKWKQENPDTPDKEQTRKQDIPTDDSEVFFEAGYSVLTVPLHHPNPKLTTLDDYAYLTRLWERGL